MHNNGVVAHERLHALDALRAAMMLLGVVFHVSLYYAPPPGVSVTDPLNTTLLAGLLGFLIHCFRMPVFFAIAGFFSCLLYQRRGLGGMLQNRLVRIGIPFVAGMIILTPLVSLAYSVAITYPPGSTPPGRTLLQLMLPGNLMHLWFLLLLLVYYALVACLDRLTGRPGKTVFAVIEMTFRKVIERPALRIVVLALLCTPILLPIRGNLGTPSALVPNTETGVMGIFYFIFFGVGWLLYLNHHLLPGFVKGAWLNFALGLLTSFALLACYAVLGTRGLLGSTPVVLVVALLNGLTSWLMTFGLLGLFLRYLDQPSARVRYVVDASYWVYLVYFPLAILIPGLMKNFDLSAALIKMPVSLLVILLVCFVSYDLLVRKTVIGKILNGRRYARGLPA
jgi:glucan biosynthesis protein C